MTINELRAIVNNCETDGKQEVRVRVDGDIKVCPLDIDTFGLYSDGLVLNIKIECVLKED